MSQKMVSMVQFLKLAYKSNRKDIFKLSGPDNNGTYHDFAEEGADEVEFDTFDGFFKGYQEYIQLHK
jgi:hypothetical protein